MINTKIEWTDMTWNPIAGCSRVSEGCRNCYAESMARRFKGPGMAYDGLVGDDGRWTGKIKFSEARLLDPLRWKSPRRIFVNSMSDLFHPNVSDEMQDKIFAVMALCPQHTFQVLTKRPEALRLYLSGPWGSGVSGVLVDWLGAKKITTGQFMGKVHRLTEPLPNVWVGVSVEDQTTADERIPLLLQTPAALRFISAEPLLRRVTLDPSWIGGFWCDVCEEWMPSPVCDKLLDPAHGDDHIVRRNILDWVIAGGESGPHARPMHPDWARSLRDQCVSASIPFFFKQWGEWSHADYKKPAGTPGKYALMPRDGTRGMYETTFTELDHYPRQCTSFGAIVRECVGKKAAGDLLDGVQWHQFPEATR